MHWPGAPAVAAMPHRPRPCLHVGVPALEHDIIRHLRHLKQHASLRDRAGARRQGSKLARSGSASGRCTAAGSQPATAARMETRARLLTGPFRNRAADQSGR